MLSGSKNPNWKGGKIHRNCIVCSKDFDIPRSWTKRENVSYGKLLR